MTSRRPLGWWTARAASLLAIASIASASALAHEHDHSVLVLTSTNGSSANSVVVFKLDSDGRPSLPLSAIVPTGGAGGAGGNAGILQFKDDVGVVANYGSNTLTRLARHDDFITLAGTLKLASGCQGPDSVALANDHVFAVGTNCAESHRWPSGALDRAIKLTDASAAQIVVGRTWSAVTLKSGSVLQLPLTRDGGLNGAMTPVALPESANNTPLGAGFWGDVLGFTPAHSPDSFALVNRDREVSPVVGPTPPFPTNAPCWVAKGPGNVWYTGNSPGQAISIFFSTGQGGVFYKSVALPGTPTDITVSADKKLLAVIYSASNNAYVAVFSIDSYGDLTPVATSSPIGVPSYSGVAISE